jgi:acetyl esterase/lipase
VTEYLLKTYTYKKTAGHSIKADIIRRPVNNLQPAIVWIHGGALIAGARQMINPDQRELYLDAGYTIIAIDYRLAPETLLPDIAKDITDAILWVRENHANLQIQPNCLAIIGHSAGAYLALLSGIIVYPAPNAVISFYGYGDITGDWYSKPDDYYLTLPHISKREAYDVVGTDPISNDPGNLRSSFYRYCRQQGLWPNKVVGADPQTNPSLFAPYNPLFHINSNYPPTLLLHGEADTDVPFQQSLIFAQALQQAHVAHELISIPKGNHCFDSVSDSIEVKIAMLQVIRFLKQYVHS